MKSFTRPLPLGAVIVLLVNDHWLKGAGFLPAWLTGKLSDVAGLFFFPVLLATLARYAFGERTDRKERTERTGRYFLEETSVVVTGVVFAVLKLWPAASDWATRSWGVVVCDPTDLVALPSLVLAYLYMRRAPLGAGVERQKPRRSGATEAVGILVASFASLATSPPYRPFAAWQVQQAESRVVGCARVEVWVSKSGKEGVGVSLSVRASEGCDVRLEGATLAVADHRFPATDLPRGPLVDERPVYVPFLFDNEALWNDGKRDGDLRLRFVVSGEPAELVVPMKHVFTHSERYTPPPTRKQSPVLLLATDPDAGVAEEAP